jgi:hypothetical protein
MEFEFIKNKILLLTPKWVDDIKVNPYMEQVCNVRLTADGLQCTLMFPCDGGELRDKKASIGVRFPVFYQDGLKAFGLLRLGPGTWKVDGVVSTDAMHAYVILCGVPEPAPWEPSTFTMCSADIGKVVVRTEAN